MLALMFRRRDVSNICKEDQYLINQSLNDWRRVRAGALALRDLANLSGPGDTRPTRVTALYCTSLHFTALYCTSLHFTALHFTVLYITALYSLH